MATEVVSPPQSIDKSDRRVRRMFGQIAGRYDFLNHLLSLGIDRYWRWWTVRLVPPRGNQPILDVCTGTGDLAFAYAKAAEGRVPVIAADFCQEMLEIGIQKTRNHAQGNTVRFIEADTQSLPLPDNYCQIVSVAFGLRNVADTDRGLAEMTRVCAPSGRVAVLEFSMPRHQPFRAIYGWYFRNILPRIGQLLARNSHDAYHYLPATVSQFPEREALAARMEAAGLENVRFHPLTFGVATLYVGRKPE
jgi:demethylmenaquinone methyltransferase/2-methoxy-6-polyprenyl-1,4-benzoquinol methylase